MATDGVIEATDLRRSDFVVKVRDVTPFLPKVAFVVITLASFAGALFTGHSLGVSGGLLVLR